jgi:hypothetical protein
MQGALIGASLLMGLVGGPHCVAMCAPASAGVIRIVRAPLGGDAVASGAWGASACGATPFHLGRIAGYAAAGAVAATAVQGLAFASVEVAALRPLWVLLHVFVFGWGLALAATGRQPLWMQGLGRSLAARMRLAGSATGLFATGALWVAMPCGLLYSALMLASLGNGPLEGAAMMALFALGSGVSLALAPWLWQRLQRSPGGARREWGTRLAGVLLAAVAVRAVWIDLSHQIAIWCS